MRMQCHAAERCNARSDVCSLTYTDRDAECCKTNMVAAPQPKRMTVYERMCQDKVFAASILSMAYHKTDYEDNDYDPAAMEMLDKAVQEEGEAE